MRVPFYIQLALRLISAAAFLAGVLLALLGLVFFGNFNFGNHAQLGIFAATVFAPIFVACCWRWFQARPSALTAALTLASYAMAAVAWYLWSIPAARGLVH